MNYETRIVSLPVCLPADTVYEYAHRIENLPHWASGLATTLRNENGEWFTDSPAGRVTIAMAPRNPYGVLDHDVTLPDGVTLHIAFRVTTTGDGSLLALVALRMPGETDEAFEQDVAHVAKDLQALKTLIEKNAAA
jgi:hypothetical protein